MFLFIVLVREYGSSEAGRAGEALRRRCRKPHGAPLLRAAQVYYLARLYFLTAADLNHARGGPGRPGPGLRDRLVNY